MPEPSELTEPFWAAARERRLVRPCCNACGASFFTPQIACPRCLSTDWAYRESGGRGTVYSATVVHRAPYPGFTSPYHVAIVDLDEGWSMLTNIIDTGDGDAGARAVPIGARVAVDWLPLDERIVLPVFRTIEDEVSA
ncbi:MAG: OB-fold domain-containing protein [Patulibacter sp.]|nr:OB-fold domain-containing protein [Patulibacter sp.]